MDEAVIEHSPPPPPRVAALARSLGLRRATAEALCGRGFCEPDRAQRFLAAEERHDPGAFSGIEEAAARIRAHIRAGSLIAVHGDYDVDGVCATAILLRALRALDANAISYIPDRAGEGYGLSAGAVARFAARGVGLMITCDCGITAAAEVRQAREAGIEVIVTDHHSPPEALPAAAIVHPRLCSYPCADLCGAAVAHKLAQVLCAGTPAGALVEEDLDLVALATVADSVPLQGENRTLVRSGLRALACTRKVGLRALYARAGVDAARLDERAVAFALAPRLNAAGRIHRADAALELLLCTEPARARAIADELQRANEERRAREQRVLFQAEAQVTALGERPAYVLAGEDWHPGVIGIVASRLAERHHRPFALVALAGELGRGSARSIAGFDLLAALRASASHLRRYGGHRAAAGFEVSRQELQSFGAAMIAHAGGAFAAGLPVRRMRADALLHGSELSHELAEELRALAPFGAGNPPVALLLRALSADRVRTMGGGRHLRFCVEAQGTRMNAVAFGGPGPQERATLRAGGPFDGLFELELNEWRGATEARLCLRHLAAASGPQQPAGEPDADAAKSPSARPAACAAGSGARPAYSVRDGR